jgi:D-tyrosyl-tRNA(Tyr) deacylase
MRLVLQRARSARVTVAGAAVAEIGRGLLILAGLYKEDTDSSVDAAAARVRGLRLFDDPDGKMNLSCEQVGGEYLVVSQFTLCADLRKGKRPGFDPAMPPPEARRLYDRFCDALARETGRPVKKGAFGESMIVALENEGPATFVLD